MEMHVTAAEPTMHSTAGREMYTGSHTHNKILYCQSKKDQQYYSFITLTNDDRFSKIFRLWIQQEICNTTLVMFPTTHTLRSYTTSHFYHFTATDVT